MFCNHRRLLVAHAIVDVWIMMIMGVVAMR